MATINHSAAGIVRGTDYFTHESINVRRNQCATQRRFDPHRYRHHQNRCGCRRRICATECTCALTYALSRLTHSRLSVLVWAFGRAGVLRFVCRSMRPIHVTFDRKIDSVHMDSGRPSVGHIDRKPHDRAAIDRRNGRNGKRTIVSSSWAVQRTCPNRNMCSYAHNYGNAGTQTKIGTRRHCAG